jgi:hypothetical protein
MEWEDTIEVLLVLIGILLAWMTNKPQLTSLITGFYLLYLFKQSTGVSCVFEWARAAGKGLNGSVFLAGLWHGLSSAGIIMQALRPNQAFR